MIEPSPQPPKKISYFKIEGTTVNWMAQIIYFNSTPYIDNRVPNSSSLLFLVPVGIMAVGVQRT
jgi:hypothetical protein